MGLSRDVPLGDARPTAADICASLRRYLFGGDAESDAGAVSVFNERAVSVVLPHAPGDAWASSPLLPGRPPRPVFNEERFFEVYLDTEHRELRVVTRSADDYTSAVADGYARACAFAFLTAEDAARRDWWRVPVGGLRPAEEIMAYAEAQDRLDGPPRDRRLAAQDGARALRAVVALAERNAALESELRDAHRRLAEARADAAASSPLGGALALCEANAGLGAMAVREAVMRRRWEAAAAGVVGLPCEQEFERVLGAGGFFVWSSRADSGAARPAAAGTCTRREDAADVASVTPRARWVAFGADGAVLPPPGPAEGEFESAARDLGGEFAAALWSALCAAEAERDLAKAEAASLRSLEAARP